MYIQTQATPNPQTLKFLPGHDVSPGNPMDFSSADEAQGQSNLAQALFKLDDVARVFLGHNFVAITKSEASHWELLKLDVIDILTVHYLNATQEGAGPETEQAPKQYDSEEIVKSYDGETKEIVEQILDLIDNRVRPAVAQDGGDILFHDFDANSGIVRLSMKGACAGCPSSTFTLKQGIENLLKHYIPEVIAVEPVL